MDMLEDECALHRCQTAFVFFLPMLGWHPPGRWWRIVCLFGNRRSKVVVSVRWARQSLTYWSYVTAHGPRFLSASGKRIFVSERSSRSSFDWNGRRFGRDLRLLNSDEARCENLLNRASTHGGMSIGSGRHFDYM